MKHALYIGPIEGLHKKKTLVRSARQEGMLLAQFDQLGLQCDDRFFSDAAGMSTFGRRTPRTADATAAYSRGFRVDVSHGWHEFPAQDFQICEEDGPNYPLI